MDASEHGCPFADTICIAAAAEFYSNFPHLQHFMGDAVKVIG
jgi:hypothetical protein